MANPIPPILPEVVDLQTRMFVGRLKLGEVLTHARVKRSTWWRWTQGAEPKRQTLKKVSDAIDALTNSKD